MGSFFGVKNRLGHQTCPETAPRGSHETLDKQWGGPWCEKSCQNRLEKARQNDKSSEKSSARCLPGDNVAQILRKHQKSMLLGYP